MLFLEFWFQAIIFSNPINSNYSLIEFDSDTKNVAQHVIKNLHFIGFAFSSSISL